jgi:hypothetical protein
VAASPAHPEEVAGGGEPDEAEEGEDGDAEQGEQAGDPAAEPDHDDLERDRPEQDAAEDRVRAPVLEA